MKTNSNLKQRMNNLVVTRYVLQGGKGKWMYMKKEN